MGYVVQLACPGTIQSTYGTGCGCVALPVVMMVSLYGISYRIQEIPGAGVLFGERYYKTSAVFCTLFRVLYCLQTGT